jgi:hypothetical protein
VKGPFQHAVFCLSVDSDVDGMPWAESLREGPPCAAVFTDLDYGVKEAAGIDFHVSLLFRKKVHIFFRCSQVNFLA